MVRRVQLLPHDSPNAWARRNLRLGEARAEMYSNKLGVWVGNPDDDLILPRSAAVTYFDGES